MTDALLASGILRTTTAAESDCLQQTCKEEAARCTVRRKATELQNFLRELGLSSGTAPAACLVFSLEMFRKFFVNTVYVLKERPDGLDDGWPYLRCTCHPASMYARCEHLTVCRSLGLRGMRDEPINRDSLPEKTKTGRPQGSHTTVRGKAAAKKK